MTEAIVLDIEGTTSPTSSVQVDLYCYVRDQLATWLTGSGPGTAEIVARTRRVCEDDTLGATEVAVVLQSWLDEDRKVDILKDAQGLICHEGFLAGTLHGRFFPDVRPALQAWASAGQAVHIYSSGSVQNQRDWFAYAEHGSLSGFVSSYFDLASAGPKQDPGSYRKISAAVGADPARTLFVSDSPAELAAAATAGWAVAGVARPGEPRSGPGPAGIRWYESLTPLAETRSAEVPA